MTICGQEEIIGGVLRATGLIRWESWLEPFVFWKPCRAVVCAVVFTKNTFFISTTCINSYCAFKTDIAVGDGFSCKNTTVCCNNIIPPQEPRSLGVDVIIVIIEYPWIFCFPTRVASHRIPCERVDVGLVLTGGVYGSTPICRSVCRDGGETITGWKSRGRFISTIIGRRIAYALPIGGSCIPHIEYIGGVSLHRHFVCDFCYSVGSRVDYQILDNHDVLILTCTIDIVNFSIRIDGIFDSQVVFFVGGRRDDGIPYGIVGRLFFF